MRKPYRGAMAGAGRPPPDGATDVGLMTAGTMVRAGAGLTARAGVGAMTGATVGLAAWFGRAGVDVGGSGGGAAAFAAVVARRTGVGARGAARLAAGAGLAARAAATTGAAGVELGEPATLRTIGELRMTASIVRSGVGCGMFVGVASPSGPPPRPQARAPRSIAPSATTRSERCADRRRAPLNRMLPASSRRLADGVHNARIVGAR